MQANATPILSSKLTQTKHTHSCTDPGRQAHFQLHPNGAPPVEDYREGRHFLDRSGMYLICSIMAWHTKNRWQHTPTRTTSHLLRAYTQHNSNAALAIYVVKIVGGKVRAEGGQARVPKLIRPWSVGPSDCRK